MARRLLARGIGHGEDGLTTAVISVTVPVAIGCYGGTAVLTWFDRSGDRIVNGDPARR